LKISGVMICYNAEKTIEKALSSIDWVDEIIVVDSFSTDRTLEICKKFDVNLFQKEWQGYGKQRRWSVEQAKYDWIFVIDSDEEVSSELKNELLNIKNDKTNSDVYAMSWKVYYMNRWIMHSGWYPNYKERLFNKNTASWDENELHEKLIYDGVAIKLKGDLYHYTYKDIEDQVIKLNRYSTLAAEEFYTSGEKPSFIKSIVSAIWRFKKIYFLKLGFLDGLAGFTIAVMESYYVMLKYFKHAEINSSNKVTMDL